METNIRHTTNGEHVKNAQERASELIDHLIDRMGSNAAFGEPQTNGDTTVIPVSEIRTGFGFGGGKGNKEVEGEGSGAGGGGSVIPLGYIHITKDQVRFRPFYNVTKLSIAGMILGALLITKIGKWLKK